MGRMTRGAAGFDARGRRAALQSVTWLLVACAITLWQPAAAAAGWTGSASGSARARAQTIPTAATPTASVSGQDVSVSWTATTLSGGTPATGYVVRRYNASLVSQTVLSDCASVTTSSCVEHNVPAGTWTYSVQATYGNWVGPEGSRSSAVTVSAGVFTITAGQKIRAGANVTGGSVSGFTANESVTFRLDSTSGTVLTASVSSVGPTGSVAGFTVTIPAGTTEGDHRIVAVGSASTTATSDNTFLFDSVVPTNTLSLGNPVNAFLNGTTLWFDSGVAGSFNFVDAVGDSGSGPASATFPTFTATRWTTGGGSVSTPSGGPFTSGTYSWTSGPATPANQTITGFDAAGNSTAATITFTADNTNPTIANTNLRIAPIANTTTAGFIAQGSQYYVYANATDAGAGIGTVTANVNNITTGQTAVPLVAGSYTVAGVSYAYRSAALTANASLSAGAKNYNATATDRVGNTTTSSNASVTVENTAPTGAITAPSNGVAGASTTVTSSSADASAGVFSAEFQYRTAGAGSWTTIATDTSSPYSVTWDTTSLTDGASYDLRVITTDNAANTATSGTVTVLVDRSAPAAPSTPALAAASDSGTVGDGVTNDSTPTYTGTAEAGTTVRLYADSTQVGSATATGGSWSITASTLAAGTHSITATATDTAGNVSAASAPAALVVDTTAPTIVASTDIQIAPVGNTTTPGYVAQGGQYHVYAKPTDGGSGLATVTANVNNVTTGQTVVPMTAGSWVVGGVTYTYRSAALTANNPLTAGNKAYSVTATDVAGNSTNSGNRNVGAENTAPTGSITAPSNGWATASTNITSSSADATAGVYSAEFQYRLASGGAWTTIDVDTSSPYGVSWDTTSLTDGVSYELRVITTDNAMNTFTSSTVTVTLDRTAPAAPSVPFLDPSSDGGPAGDNLTNDSTPTFTGTAEAGTTVTIYDGATPVGTAVATGGAWTITASTLSAGAHTITAVSVDAAGNVSPASGSVVVSIDTTSPTVTSVVLANGGTAATVDTGDTGVVTFSEQMDATTFCSAWTNTGTQSLSNATITINDAGASDTLSVSTPSCTFGLGTWMVGDYVGGGPATFTGSTVSWNPSARTITVTIGTLNTFSTIKTGVTPKANEYTGNAARTDLAGNSISTSKFTNPTATGF